MNIRYNNHNLHNIPGQHTAEPPDLRDLDQFSDI